MLLDSKTPLIYNFDYFLVSHFMLFAHLGSPLSSFNLFLFGCTSKIKSSHKYPKNILKIIKHSDHYVAKKGGSSFSFVSSKVCYMDLFKMRSGISQLQPCVS